MVVPGLPAPSWFGTRFSHAAVIGSANSVFFSFFFLDVLQPNF